MSSALLFYTFSLCFSLLSIERKNKEAPERYGPVPSEGRGREFESRRVRHLQTPKAGGIPLMFCCPESQDRALN